MTSRPFLLAASLILGACRPVAPGHAPAARGTLIRNATVIDGTGAAPRIASVRIVGDRIAAVGALTPLPNERVVDATGLTLTPGFIDTHSHYDRGAFTHRDATAAVSQGITTAVVGQEGGTLEQTYQLSMVKKDSHWYVTDIRGSTLPAAS